MVMICGGQRYFAKGVPVRLVKVRPHSRQRQRGSAAPLRPSRFTPDARHWGQAKPGEAVGVITDSCFPAQINFVISAKPQPKRHHWLNGISTGRE
jgi:hypothetical protein